MFINVETTHNLTITSINFFSKSPQDMTVTPIIFQTNIDGLYNSLGITIGSWNLIISAILIIITYLIDRSYIKIGTFINAIISSIFVDLFLMLDIVPQTTSTWMDFIILAGITVLGIGGGIYNSVRMEAGARDGIMLAISVKSGASIRKVRIITEMGVLLIGWIIGDPIFIFTIIFTFIQSPIFQYVYLKFKNILNNAEKNLQKQKSHIV